MSTQRKLTAMIFCGVAFYEAVQWNDYFSWNWVMESIGMLLILCALLWEMRRNGTAKNA